MRYEVGSDLKVKRLELGVPATTIAKKLGISRQTLISKEKDETELSASELIQYCRALHIDINEITQKYFF